VPFSVTWAVNRGLSVVSSDFVIAHNVSAVKIVGWDGDGNVVIPRQPQPKVRKSSPISKSAQLQFTACYAQIIKSLN
jgi:hypothetical protein